MFVTFLFIFIILMLLSGIKLLYQYERGVVFTLGKYNGVKEPGLRWIVPVIQKMQKVDMRIKTAEIPRQEVITKDNITILANAVVYFKVIRPEDVIIKIESGATSNPTTIETVAKIAKALNVSIEQLIV